MPLPQVDVVVVAYGPEPDLDECLTSIAASTDVTVRIALVDNGCTHPRLSELAARDEVTLVSSPGNTGFAGGCDLGVAAVDGEFVALINSDAHVKPNALATLVGALSDQVGLTTGCILLADEPELVNSAGNPVQFLGACWAGGLGEPAAEHSTPHDVASASGAGCAMRRELWERLGGFDPEFFLYCEDLDLSLRVWQQGLRVRYVPAARVWHHYEFSRNDRKWYFIERNRLMVMLTVYSGRTLALLAPAIVGFELASLVRAAVSQQLRGKVEGYLWLVRNFGHVRARRAEVQARRKVSDAVFAEVLSGRINTPQFSGKAFGAGNAALGAYWSLVRRWL